MKVTLLIIIVAVLSACGRVESKQTPDAKRQTSTEYRQ